MNGKRTENNRKWVRLILALLLSALVFSMGSFALADSGTLDLSRKGSITLTLTDDNIGEAIPGGTIAIWKVADLVQNESGYVWQYTEEFSDCTESLYYLESTELIESLLAYAQENELKAEEVSIDSEGTALYEGAGVGLYLIAQTQAAEGYEAFLPFLVSIPYETSSGWVYDVDASPKVEPPTGTETEPGSESETEPASESETEPTSEGETEPTSESETESASESATEADSESETEPVSEFETEPESESETETAMESGTEADSESETESESESETEPGTEKITESTSETGSSTGTESGTETETESSTLPQTGQLYWPIPLLAVLGLLFIVIGRILTAKEKKG